MFSGKRFVTSGIAEKVPLLLQVIMWNMIDTMDEPKDYLQVFGKAKIKKLRYVTFFSNYIAVLIFCISFVACVIDLFSNIDIFHYLIINNTNSILFSLYE